MMSNQINFVAFPSVDNATEDGLLAMGGDLDLNTLVSAYAQGIFPWYNDDQPILWWSPDPRMVPYPEQVKVSRSLRRTLKKGGFKITSNRDFEAVVKACASRGQSRDSRTGTGTWITDHMHTAYLGLHKHHYAHSIEVWQNERLVGGLYGVVLGKAFFGESMFSRVSDASKVALVMLCKYLTLAEFKIIDCQVASDHLFTLGAQEIDRRDFLRLLEGVDIDRPNLNFSQSFEKVMSEDDITML